MKQNYFRGIAGIALAGALTLALAACDTSGGGTGTGKNPESSGGTISGTIIIDNQSGGVIQEVYISALSGMTLQEDQMSGYLVYDDATISSGQSKTYSDIPFPKETGHNYCSISVDILKPGDTMLTVTTEWIAGRQSYNHIGVYADDFPLTLVYDSNRNLDSIE